MIIGVFGACGTDVSTRFDEAAALATERFGDDDQLTVAISPGRVSSIRDESGRFSLELVASGPFPTVAVDNGTQGPQRVSVALGNVQPSWAFAARVGSLDAGARRDPGCVTDRASVLLSDAAPTAASGTTVQFEFEIPACARLEVSAQPAADAAEVRFVIVGAIRGDSGYLQSAIEAAASLDAEYIQFLGDIGFPGDVVAFEEFETRARAAGLPFGVTIASQDRFAETEFVARFGESDYATPVGQMRFVSIDTASGVLSDAQMRRVTNIDPRRPPGVLVSSIAPIAFGTTRGIRNLAQGSRILEELASRGVLTSFSAGGPRLASRNLGQFSLYDLAGAGASDRSVALVEFFRPWPELTSCTTSVDCDSGGLCDRGFCRRPCESDEACADDEVCDGSSCVLACTEPTDCPGPRPECRVGVCQFDPEIEVTLSTF